MTKLQFQILYRELLFRVVDPIASSDVTKLLGHFAAVLIIASMLFTFAMECCN